MCHRIRIARRIADVSRKAGPRDRAVPCRRCRGHRRAARRAKAYGISVEELPAFYAKRTLLNETILPEDIANACFVFVSGLLNKATGNVLNIDGGIAMAFVR